jgi:SAM-dependent methyltransferase
VGAAQYPLARSEHELKRLALQAEVMKPLTRRTFEDAGIREGMRVLDLGSGFGDVCMLLADMTGKSGSVVGLDIDPRSVREPEKRVAEAGYSNISLVTSDFASYTPAAPFDAVVGRLILMYHPDPPAALKAVVQHLKPGGIVAFQEPWMMPPAGPESTMKRCLGVLFETFRRSGAHTDLGMRLHAVFTKAGLPPPRMRLEAPLDGREDSLLLPYFVETLASLRPKAIELEVPGAAELDPEVDGRRSLAEVRAFGYAVMALPVVSAWCRT